MSRQNDDRFSYFWHDYETFGADPKRDKPAQFAGIRTDADFNIIGEPLTLYCQPPSDMLGHPEATLITGITPQHALEHGVPEPEFIAAIVSEMARPGTCSVGYNNLAFDDEVTRHTLWRNFFDPYEREYKNGCSRWDVINMVRLTYALRPDGIQWPQREDGAPSFRLEDLAAANGLAQERAHDALSDVHATIALARLIREHQPRLFEWVVTHRDKASAAALLDLDTHKPALHASSKFPAANGCLSPVMPIARHPVNRNCIITYDLRSDPEPLLELAPDEIFDRLFTPSEDLPDDTPRIALKGVHVNKCPVLAPFEMMRESEAARLNLDINTCRRHWKAIHDRMSEVAAKATAVFEARVFDNASDVEAGLYDGFIDNADRDKARQVHTASPEALADGHIVFADNRLNELLFRYRARHYPASLADAERDDWRNWVAKRLEFAPDGGLTLDEYDETVATLMERVGSDPARLQLLLDLKAWGDRQRRQL
ncbi:exodeoxyribonuclease I [Salinisphaera sp. Q1T1-3]|uniref:exodeoxyribonuclease I n=1 Tax=Salinisphaera sp. Q1T1-3 TaxID=2321229 RepID=UPI000E7516B1|nr:exodeoxyribonuclease I [Salinisphaera sp. Q1T1-3]RJS91351.1 exodeoxyribonuclease I [Salinisphaera sp. Q1T1-3]